VQDSFLIPREIIMGWLFTPGITRRSLIEERTKDWQRTTDEGTHIAATCLAHCFRGGCFSGVLWSVWERNTFTEDDKLAKPTERWIACDRLQCRSGVWGYKDMEESMGPFYYSCPLSYLELVPVEKYGGHAVWREKVKAYHTERRAKRLMSSRKG
jgi:hypothetical protein